MAFWGSSFIFDDIPCEQFDLMIYEVGGLEDDEAAFASSGEIVEETVGRRWKPYFYSVKQEKKLEFEIVFGVNQRRIDSGRYLDRYEIAEVAAWLTGHTSYKWLMIDQEDMEHVRYRCMITSLSSITYGNLPWAMRATITCDSPYAYMPEYVEEHLIDGSQTVMFNNVSSINGYYYPIIEFLPDGGQDLFIENITDRNRTFSLIDIPESISLVTIDNDRCIISNDQDLNLYANCNYRFLRLKRGYNHLNIIGNGTLRIRCVFPIDIGG